MTLDKIRTGSGRRFRTEGLQETALPIPYDAAAMPGATVLGTDGQTYASIKADGVYSWARILSSKGIVIGPDRTNFTVGLAFGGEQYRPAIQVEGSTAETATIAVTGTSSGNLTPRLILAASRGSTVGSDAPLQDGDTVGILLFSASDGTALIGNARISARVNGTPGGGATPTEILLATRQVGDTTLPVRMRVTPQGNIQINNTSGTERLSVTGNIQLTSAADSFMVGTNNVVGSRKTGWAAAGGTATRTTFATSNVTTEQLAERVKALIDDLTSHGLIGA
jgi:hypothetical protein